MFHCDNISKSINYFQIFSNIFSKQKGTRAVAFSQYPQFSCTTTGSSLNHLWRELKRLDMGEEFEWSVIDRWPTHDGFLTALTDRVQKGLDDFDEEDRDKVVSFKKK